MRARDSPPDFTPKGEKEGEGLASSTSTAAVVATSCRRAAFCPLSSPSSRSSSRLCLTRRCSFPRPLHTFVISAIHPPLPSTSRRCRVLRSRVLNDCCTPPYLRVSAGKFVPEHCLSSVWFLRLAKKCSRPSTIVRVCSRTRCVPSPLLVKNRVRVLFFSWHGFEFGVNSSSVSLLRISTSVGAQYLDSTSPVMFLHTTRSSPVFVTETLPLCDGEYVQE